MFKKLLVSALVFASALTAGAYITGVTSSADDGFSPLFNTATNVSGIGDEKDFLRIYDGSNLVNTKEVCSGHANMWIYVHNNRPSANNNDPNKPGDWDGVGVAKDTKVKFSLPGDYSNKTTASANISASNAVNSPTDTAYITCGGQKVKVEFVEVVEVKSNPAGNYTLTGDITSAEGATLSYKGNDGVVPGCWEYRASIVVKVKVTPQPPEPKPQALKCDALVVNREGLAVSAKVEGSTENGATITGYRIEFNGTENVVNEQSADYTFNGFNQTHTVRGYVIGTVDGQPNQKVTSNACYYEFKEDKEEPKPESLTCDVLKLDILDSKKREVEAKVTGSAQNTTIDGYHINFGDGTTVDEQTAKHSYGDYGKYTVTAFVSGTVDGQEVKVGGDGGCKQMVEFKEPPKPEEQALVCDALNLELFNEEKKYVKVSVDATAQNTKIDSYEINFGDGSSPVMEQTAEHTYGDFGTYKIVASVTGQVDGETVTDTNANCEKTVEFTEPEPEKPTEPQVPELPVTGPGAVVGLFSGVSILGALGHRAWMVRRLQ